MFQAKLAKEVQRPQSKDKPWRTLRSLRELFQGKHFHRILGRNSDTVKYLKPRDKVPFKGAIQNLFVLRPALAGLRPAFAAEASATAE